MPTRKQVFARPVLHLSDYREQRTLARPSTMQRAGGKSANLRSLKLSFSYRFECCVHIRGFSTDIWCPFPDRTPLLKILQAGQVRRDCDQFPTGSPATFCRYDKKLAAWSDMQVAPEGELSTTPSCLTTTPARNWACRLVYSAPLDLR